MNEQNIEFINVDISEFFDIQEQSQEEIDTGIVVFTEHQRQLVHALRDKLSTTNKDELGPLNKRIDDLKKLAALLKTRVEIFSEIPEKVNWLEEFGEYDTELFVHKKMKTDKEVAKSVLPLVKAEYEKITDWNQQTVHEATMKVVSDMGVKNGVVFWCARVAMTGKMSTPGGVDEVADLLGKQESIRRIDFSIELLK